MWAILAQMAQLTLYLRMQQTEKVGREKDFQL